MSIKKKINDYIGKIGETFIDHITVIREIPFNGYYGPVLGYCFYLLTDDGYTLKWFTSDTNLTINAKKIISYEIIDHNEYNGYKSTIIKVKKIMNREEQTTRYKG